MLLHTEIFTEAVLVRGVCVEATLPEPRGPGPSWQLHPGTHRQYPHREVLLFALPQVDRV